MSDHTGVGLAIIVRWEGEPVGRHFLLGGQQLTIGSDAGADLYVPGSRLARERPLIQAAAEGYQIQLPAGGRLTCRDAAPNPGGAYRTPERQVFEADPTEGGLNLRLEHGADSDVCVGPWRLTIHTCSTPPAWALDPRSCAHSREVLRRGFRQSLAWHWDLQRQRQRGLTGPGKARCWPYLLGSLVVHLVALLVVLTLPPDSIPLPLELFEADYDEWSEPDLPNTIRSATIRLPVDLRSRNDTRAGDTELQRLRESVSASLARERGALRSCATGWMPGPRVDAVFLVDQYGSVTEVAVHQPGLGVAARACMETVLARWTLAVSLWPLKLTATLDLAPPAVNRTARPQARDRAASVQGPT